MSESDAGLGWDGRDRRRHDRRRLQLSDEQIKAIAKVAAQEVMSNMYQEVGKSVIKKFVWAVGLITVGLLMFLGAKGYLK